MIRLTDYPRSKQFNANNRLINTIRFGNNTKATPSCNNLTDPRTGEILYSQITLPRNIANLIRRNGIMTLCDVDTRFCDYFLSEELIGEAIATYLMPILGQSLGLTTNYAGDKAYSPEELRSPEFTQENGISASVMARERYNYLARPGDKQRGVVLFSDRIGPYDKYAIKWLYAPIEGDEKATLNRWIQEREGDARYFCGTKPNNYAYDPRCQAYTLGSDAIEALDAKFSHLKYIVENGDKWFDDEDIPQIYKELFPEYLFLEAYYQTFGLTNYIGGVYLNFPVEGNRLPNFTPVPRSEQERYAKKLFEILTPESLSWMDSNLNFLRVGSDNATMSNMMLVNLPAGTLAARKPLNMTLAIEKSENPYTVDDLWDTTFDYLLKEVRAADRVPKYKRGQIAQFLIGLIGVSPSLKANYKYNTASVEALADSPEFFSGLAAMPSIDASTVMPDEEPKIRPIEANESVTMRDNSTIFFFKAPDLDTQVYQRLTSLRSLFRSRLQSTSDANMRGYYQYYLLMIDRALEIK